MRTVLFVVCAFLMVGCNDVQVQDDRIDSIVRYGTVKFVDSDAGITCYTVSDSTGVGISCVR